MDDADEWARLQEAWGGDASASPSAAAPLPDVTAMIARARRERWLIVWTIAGEWALALVGLTLLVRDWSRATASGATLLWWVYFLLFMVVVMIGFTWTRVAALREPQGASLRDWLQLRRRRARLSLRLVKWTRWSTIPMLPAPLFVAVHARSEWAATWGFVFVALMLAGGLVWASRKAARMKAEIAEVDALAREWLDDQDGTTTA